jgi:cyclic pyranopterin phosphate synthase
VTADGELKVCLFGDESLSLRQLLRESPSDQETSLSRLLLQRVRETLHTKKPSLGGHGSVDELAQARNTNRPMVMIGG